MSSVRVTSGRKKIVRRASRVPRVSKEHLASRAPPIDVRRAKLARLVKIARHEKIVQRVSRHAVLRRLRARSATVRR
ncbi:MAG: hypothetical protein J0M17_25190 [Planctomycetes bacterium]|nr:hypothetical protein [Planctomycetota bacterium]